MEIRANPLRSATESGMLPYIMEKPEEKRRCWREYIFAFDSALLRISPVPFVR
jgi:hypothetical protein